MVIRLKCPRCSKEWDYKGENKFVTSCSNCKTSVYFGSKNSKNVVRNNMGGVDS